MGIEDPEADVAEQLRPAASIEDDEPAAGTGGLPSEADPADVAEQREVVDVADDYER
jgi:hypothetical protein